MTLRHLAVAALVGASAAGCGSALVQPRPRTSTLPDRPEIASAVGMGSGEVSDRVHFYMEQEQSGVGQVRLRHLVLWRGEHGWYRHREAAINALWESGLIDTTRVRAQLERANAAYFDILGDITLEVRFDEPNRRVWVLGREMTLGDANVVVVDRIDGVGGSPSVRTARIDPTLDSSNVAVTELLTRSAELRRFVR
jgi:hypothetical protein